MLIQSFNWSLYQPLPHFLLQSQLSRHSYKFIKPHMNTNYPQLPPTPPQNHRENNHSHDKQAEGHISEVEKMQRKMGSIDLEEASAQYIEASLGRIREEIRHYQDEVSRKIAKYYSQLRPLSLEREKTVDSVCQVLRKEVGERFKLLEFQEIEIKQIKEQEASFDSKDNIEFSIPIEISETKKKIVELEKFIHVARIKQKKKSEDLVKVEKTNLEQFQKTAMLRTNLEHAMLYEISLNQREMKIDDRVYDFESKIETLNTKFDQLQKEVEAKNILVSSNKHLLLLKNQKNMFSKKRDDAQKKMRLSQSAINKELHQLQRDINLLQQNIQREEQKEHLIEAELSSINASDQSYLSNHQIKSKLMKNLSFNYAETILKMKDKPKSNRLQGQKDGQRLIMSSNYSLDKPNFKIKRTTRNGYQLKQKESMTASLILMKEIKSNPETVQLNSRQNKKVSESVDFIGIKKKEPKHHFSFSNS